MLIPIPNRDKIHVVHSLLTIREVAQSGLGHLNGVQGVAGSNPALPTIVVNRKVWLRKKGAK